MDEGIDAVIVDSVLKIRNGLTKSSQARGPWVKEAKTEVVADLPSVPLTEPETKVNGVPAVNGTIVPGTVSGV